MSEDYCPNEALHTPCPRGYMKWHVWAEEKQKTHQQVRCTECGRWVIWIPIPKEEK